MFSQDPVNSCDRFDKVFLEVLDKHAPKNTKYEEQIIRLMYLKLCEKQL